MGFRAKRFELAVAAQVLSIFVVCAAAAWLAATTHYYATMLVLALVLVLQVSTLIKYVRRTNRDLTRFLLAVKHSDFSQSFSSSPRGGSFAELSAAFEEVLKRFREARTAKEEQASYLETIVQQVPVAVIAWDESGRIDLFNHEARRLLGAAAIWHLGDLASVGEDFGARLAALAPGEPRLLEVELDGELLELNAAVAELRTSRRTLKIATLQDIRGQLETRELAAWQNLIRILTHEIMNSVTPIASLAATASELLSDAAEGNAAVDGSAAVGGSAATAGPAEAGAAADAGQAILDARRAVETIETRSSGLLRFVESYRRLTRLPAPALRRIRVEAVLDRVATLMQPELERRRIALDVSVTPSHLEIDADPDLVEQALINLLRNAMDAVAGIAEPAITMAASVGSSGRAVVSVADNGRGMDEDVRQNIFVPFFTTKRDGSGIGLSLIRQIMRAHSGSVGARSSPGRGTEMRLTF